MFINPLVISHGSDAGEYVISVRAENHVSSVSDSVMVMVAPSVPHITIEALGSVCLVGEPCLFAAKLSNGTLAPQGNFIYKWSNQVGGGYLRIGSEIKPKQNNTKKVGKRCENKGKY